jgi:beta-galactosidase
VIGWQLDNEYNRFCYCPRCQALFQKFLAERYGSLEALNERWSTGYWSQTYSAWEQIPIPIGEHNPGLMLEWKRFNTHCYRQFQRVQLDALRPHLLPGVWVTHNFMGWYDGFDHYQMAEDLDLASWDYYVGSGHHEYLRHAAIHDLTYGFKRKNFWVMETQPGTVNWSTVNNVLNKGEARVMAWQAVGHGAVGVLYWQWRSALGGQEQYHGTLVDQSGRPRPFYEEVQQLGKEFACLSDALAGSKSEAKVAIINDYESRWSIQWQRHHKDFDYIAHLNHYYKAFAALNIPVDIISPEASLAGYRIVVAPALLILEEERLKNLQQLIHRGSCLIVGTRSGMKDQYNALFPARQPGPLVELTGVEVEEYYALERPAPVKGNWFSGTSQIWAERLRFVDERASSVVAKYLPSNGWLDNQNAITVHVHGGIGLVYYVGCYLDDAAQLAFTERILKLRNVTAPLLVPSGVEVCARTNPQGEKIYIIINHAGTERRIQIPWKAYELLSGFPGSGELRLLPYSVVVLKRVEENQ